MLYYDSAARTGWRFYGTASVYKEGDLRQQIMKRVVKGEMTRIPTAKATACSSASIRSAATAGSTSFKNAKNKDESRKRKDEISDCWRGRRFEFLSPSCG
jgi:hypothetical protein